MVGGAVGVAVVVVVGVAVVVVVVVEKRGLSATLCDGTHGNTGCRALCQSV